MSEERGLRVNPLLRWWVTRVVDKVDHLDVIDRVNEEAHWSGHFAFMTVMSAGIAILGLLLSSPAVVIGAMLISPLMGPIIGFGFGLALVDFDDIRRALASLAVGAGLAILITALVVLVSPLQTVTSEIAARTRPNLFDLGVAIFSGLAGTYAMIRGRHGTIVGVAIAVALMPPLAVVGFGLATLNGAVFWGATFLFLTNLMAISLSAAVLARLYGFARRLSPQQTWLQLSLVILTLLALAVPLGIALRQIAWEAVVSRQARDLIAARFDERARVSQVEIDYGAQPLRVSAVVFTPSYRGAAERDAATALSAAIGRPAEVDIEQVRIGDADAQASQLAAARGAAADRSADRIAQRLALVSGRQPDQVVVDREHRVARVRAAPLPGATLEAYRMLETRIAEAEPGWTLLLVPPVEALTDITLDADADDTARGRALALVVWAAQREEMPVAVSGTGAEQLVGQLQGAGVDARLAEGSAGTGPVRFVWRTPGG
jgi:uncharacterized hydrophobic protein (TIGR00271 family)